ncbi:FAD-dependent oxidoreductase [Raoultibacter timonensis]|uniref:FAD-binding dehydrogenase n=1 Tax=Raoultibacter timonensis TaxID=1907662 RepID=A0ABN6MEL8_9ACTN|nr:FAD-dependent oxidoreductase [Raoultibacter timonensis]BDE95086.1 FAD-binding dehydrogenase [Raoultibacter timonensis]BDF49689.1 FAD-binding dehydrogenase [Raoultibacter timonensis]
MEGQKKGLSRRSFLGLGAASVAAMGVAGLTGCAPQESEAVANAKVGVKTYSWETEPEAIGSVEGAESVDVVVVGAGMAGLSAACSAAEKGASVLVLEKTGIANFRGIDYGAIGGSLQKEVGIDLTARKEDVLQEVLRWGGHRGDYRVVKAWVDHSAEALDWAAGMLTDHGITVAPMPEEMQVIPDAWYEHFATDAFQIVPTDDLMAEGAEAGYEPPFAIGWAKAFTAYAEELGVEIRFNVTAEQLIRGESGPVTGVVYKDGSKHYQVDAKSVVLAAGGYGADAEMMDAFVPNHEEDIYNITTPAHNTGDGIRMGAWAGASIDPAPHCPMYFDEGVEGLEHMPSIPLTRQPWLYLNDFGERFCNEDMPYAYVCRAHNAQPRHMKWVVWDAKWETDGPAMGMVVCKDFRSPLHNPEEIQQFIEEGQILSADTIEGLLAKMEGIDQETAKATIEHYNELCAAGVDTDFGKRAQCLSSITEPPFYAVHSGTTLLITLGGLEIDENQQVLDAEKKPIEGLWAAGNCSGSFFFDDYPITISGVSHGRACTGGRRAGQFAADRAKQA